MRASESSSPAMGASCLLWMESSSNRKHVGELRDSAGDEKSERNFETGVKAEAGVEVRGRVKSGHELCLGGENVDPSRRSISLL